MGRWSKYQKARKAVRSHARESTPMITPSTLGARPSMELGLLAMMQLAVQKFDKRPYCREIRYAHGEKQEVFAFIQTQCRERRELQEGARRLDGIPLFASGLVPAGEIHLWMSDETLIVMKLKPNTIGTTEVR
jgi:hypothetical protein